MKNVSFTDIVDIPEETLVQIGSLLVFDLLKIDNFSANFSWYYSQGLLPFLKDDQAVFSYLALIIELNTSQKILSTRKRKVGFLVDRRISQKQRICSHEELVILGKICLVFISQGLFDFNLEEAARSVEKSHIHFDIPKSELISATSSIPLCKTRVFFQIKNSGIIDTINQKKE